eukprot:scaffold79859_cov44-Phaeocystis_antarctica.AAC.2
MQVNANTAAAHADGAQSVQLDHTMPVQHASLGPAPFYAASAPRVCPPRPRDIAPALGEGPGRTL